MGLVAMKRSEPTRPGGPVTADVDEARIAEWRKAGWELSEPVAPVVAPNVDLDEMTVPELRAYAKEHGVNIPAALKDRAKIVAALAPTLEVKPGPLG